MSANQLHRIIRKLCMITFAVLLVSIHFVISNANISHHQNPEERDVQLQSIFSNNNHVQKRQEQQNKKQAQQQQQQQQQQPQDEQQPLVRRQLKEEDKNEEKLGICQGYCSNDDECDDKLICYKDEITLELSGCPASSGNFVTQNFCYLDMNRYSSNNNFEESSTSLTSDIPTASPMIRSLWGSALYTRSKDEYPLQKCEGHCTSNNDCDSHFLCYVRTYGEIYVPGCRGIGDSYGTNYCYDPFDLKYYTPAPTLAPTSNPTMAPVTSSPSKVPVTLSPTKAPITLAPLSSAPISIAPITPRPTPNPTSSPVVYIMMASDQGGSSQTLPPTYPGTNNHIPLSEPGNDGIPYEVFPLQRCQGDCDGDNDCQPGLICFFRDGYTAVPGCLGSGYENTDYCIDKIDDPARPPVLGAFRIKMYWELGYDWQQTYREANWCFQCLNKTCYGDTITLTPECLENVCDEGDILTLRPCGASNAWFEFVQEYNGTVKSLSEMGASYDNMKTARYEKFVESYNRQMAKAYYDFTRAQYEYYGGMPSNRTYFIVPEDLRLGPDDAFNRILARNYYEFTQTRYNNVTQIVHLRVATTNLCLQLMNDDNTIQLEQCDYSNNKQNFKPGNGDFFGKTFELMPQTSAGCLTQQHEPRDYEMIFKDECPLARKYNTSLFNRY
jgi:hypothetical protein